MNSQECKGIAQRPEMTKKSDKLEIGLQIPAGLDLGFKWDIVWRPKGKGFDAAGWPVRLDTSE